jgi:hypothetical protein
MDFEEDEQGSPMVDRGERPQHETSQGRYRGTSDGEGYDNDDIERKLGRQGNRRPPPGGYRPYPRDSHPPPEWEGRYSPGFYHHQTSSSSRAPYRTSTSPEPYGRLGERGGWWGEGREDWARPKCGRYDDLQPPPYSEDQYAYEHNV